jgi:hypothetical protein
VTSQTITTSAALFLARQREGFVPLAWFERAVDYLKELGVEPILFTAHGGDFLFDDCHLLADEGELHIFEEVIVARQGQLVASLKRQEIDSLGLDSPRRGAKTRADWRADARASLIGDDIYLGAAEELVADAAALLKRACEMSKGLFDVRYGFAYKMPLDDGPGGYASGSRPFRLADFRRWMKDRAAGIEAPKNADDLWNDELNGQRRHLTGLFRAAFPANVLSDVHVEAADLANARLGKLSPLDDALWLWQLAPDEIAPANAWLESKGLLVHQHSAGRESV